MHIFPKILALELAPKETQHENMNIEGNIQSHAVTSLLVLSTSKWVRLTYFFNIQFSFMKANWLPQFGKFWYGER